MTEEEFDTAIAEACRIHAEYEIKQIEESMEEYDYEPSDRFKRKMNRLFREQVGSKNIPHPEVDTAAERFRSSLVRRCLVIGDKLRKN